MDIFTTNNTRKSQRAQKINLFNEPCDPPTSGGFVKLVVNY